MGVGTLQLVLGVCEEGFEVVVGGWDAVYKVFEDKGESRDRVLEGGISGGRGWCTSLVDPEIPWKC